MAWGTVPDWITWLVALAALLFASKAARAASGQLHTARDQLKALEVEAESRAEEQKRAQASTVAAWLDQAPSGFVALYVNRSGLPVYDVKITFISPNNFNQFFFQVLAPTDNPTALEGVTDLVRQAAVRNDSVAVSWQFHRQGTGTGTLRTVGPEQLQKTGWQDGTQIGPIGLTVEFNDSNNRRWCRDLHGKLAEAPPDDYQRMAGE